MESANTTCGILLRWWNFSGVSQLDQAVLVEEVEREGLPRTLKNPRSLNQLGAKLEHLTASRFAKTGMNPAGSDSPLSILDRYLDEYSDFDALENFESCLMADKRWFTVTTENGKSCTGSLWHLCSIRLASLLALRPNRLFFFLPGTPDDVLSSTELILFDPQFVLPTLSARAWRQNVGLNLSQIAVSKAHLFLFGNYLPEFIGNCVAIESPRSKVRLGGGATLAHEELPIPSLNRLGNRERTPLHFRFIRLFVLALAAVVKRLAKNKFFSSKWLFRVQRFLVGPTSSQRLVGRNEHCRLTPLVQPKSEK